MDLLNSHQGAARRSAEWYAMATGSMILWVEKTWHDTLTKKCS
jgi:hypothetical protein